MATNNKNLWLYGGIAAVGVGAIALFSGSKNTKKEPLGQDTFGDTPTPTTTPTTATPPKVNIPIVAPKPTTPVALNTNLVLKNGSRGSEVVALQKLLGITADGIFGNGTEAALKSKKGVISITLAKYKTTPDINRNSYPVGTKVFSNNKNGAKLYGNRALPNGVNESTGELDSTIAYGKVIGIIRGASSGAKWYRVETDAWVGTKICWVLASDVKNY